MKTIFLIFFAATMICGCAIIRPGKVALKQRLGKLSPKIYPPGTVFYSPFTTKILKIPVQTNDLELSLSLPSKEGLSVNAQISILYHLDTDSVVSLVKNIGLNYTVIISNVFRSASADVCAQYPAKDLHSGMRPEIERAIKDRMSGLLNKRGIIIEAVLMKSIQLPQGLASSIEQKLQAEQEVMRMEFVLKQAKLEADRKVIEATGSSNAQKILSDGLTDEIIELRTIEAFLELAKSPNAKVIITDGQTPLLINDK